METTIWHLTLVSQLRVEALKSVPEVGIRQGYIGIIEKKMETAIYY